MGPNGCAGRQSHDVSGTDLQKRPNDLRLRTHIPLTRGLRLEEKVRVDISALRLKFEPEPANLVSNILLNHGAPYVEFGHEKEKTAEFGI